MNISCFFKDTKPFGRLVGLFFVFLAGFVIAVPLSRLPEAVDPADRVAAIRLGLLSGALSQLVVFLLPAWLFALLFTVSPRRSLGLRLQGRYWILGLVGMVAIVLLVPLADWLTAWNDTWTFGSLEASLRQSAQEVKQVMVDRLSPTAPADFLLQVLFVALLPAVCEEMFFRAALQPTLQALVRNPHVGILLGAVAFSLAHGDPYGFLPRLLLGLLLGYLFWYTGSLVVSVCAHFVNNLAVVTAFHFYNTGVSSLDPFAPLGLPWPLTLGCTLGAILLFLLYFVKNPQMAPGDASSAPSATGC